jgi:hypothetical protein
MSFCSPLASFMKSLQEANKELIDYDIFVDSAKIHTVHEEEEEEDPIFLSSLNRSDTSFRQQRKNINTTDRRNLAPEDKKEEERIVKTPLIRCDSSSRQEQKKITRWEGGCSTSQRRHHEPVRFQRRPETLASSPKCPKRQVSITPTCPKRQVPTCPKRQVSITPIENDAQMADISRLALLVIEAR